MCLALRAHRKETAPLAEGKTKRQHNKKEIWRGFLEKRAEERWESDATGMAVGCYLAHTNANPPLERIRRAESVCVETRLALTKISFQRSVYKDFLTSLVR